MIGNCFTCSKLCSSSHFSSFHACGNSSPRKRRHRLSEKKIITNGQLKRSIQIGPKTWKWTYKTTACFRQGNVWWLMNADADHHRCRHHPVVKSVDTFFFSFTFFGRGFRFHNSKLEKKFFVKNKKKSISHLINFFGRRDFLEGVFRKKDFYSHFPFLPPPL